ncbi:hypothetical protein BOO22_20615 [Vibrio cidicii]|uniref:hypothetical protein n=1 Tax=Vibrio TaxID=662 RepID=UPI0018C2ED5A|nr:hypothetical protein [Vibrio cidicii]MBG0761812.1 hypothetical protein [Vibrio cidicii]
MNPDYNRALIYKMAVNLLFWLVFGAVILFMNWSKTDFEISDSAVFPELVDLLEAKQSILLFVTGFILYGVISFFSRHANTQELRGRREYFLQLALEEWANTLINVGSIMFVVGWLIEVYSYFIVTAVMYIMAFFIARRAS